jgi:hypothetical protein
MRRGAETEPSDVTNMLFPMAMPWALDISHLRRLKTELDTHASLTNSFLRGIYRMGNVFPGFRAKVRAEASATLSMLLLSVSSSVPMISMTL